MRVLAAIDNRPSSQAIIDAILKMHWREGTEIHLITILSTDAKNGADDRAPSGSVEEIENLAVNLHEALSHCAVTFIARHGDPKTTILELAEDLQAELIVIGSNCKNTMERLLIGSVCQAVLNRASCPVIVAKTPCGLAQEAAPGFRNILIPVDNSAFSDAAVKWLANFSWAQNTQFVVAAAVEQDTDFEEVNQTLNKRAADLSANLRTNKVTTVTAPGEPGQAIIDLARECNADLIVMGSHGRTGLKKVILGSVSQAVSQVAPCAVAIVRGMVAKDKSWRRTGAFGKVKTVEDIRAERFRNDDFGDAGIMPSGM
jgi:nucleotide-binding universal stress UspA family protein